MPRPTTNKRTDNRIQVSSTLKNVKTKEIDYKNVSILRMFLSGRYKILPSKITGLAAKKQRLLKNEIKKARIMGLLPFTDRHSVK